MNHMDYLFSPKIVSTLSSNGNLNWLLSFECNHFSINNEIQVVLHNEGAESIHPPPPSDNCAPGHSSPQGENLVKTVGGVNNETITGKIGSSLSTYRGNGTRFKSHNGQISLSYCNNWFLLSLLLAMVS